MNDAAMIEKLKLYVRANAEKFLQDPNITSIGIGYKSTKGKETSKLAVQFSVRSKVQPQSLSDLNTKLIPPTLKVGNILVPTDVIERSFSPSYKTVDLKPKDDRKARADIVRPGMSVGSVRTSAGTLGTFVREIQSKRIVMLSNWHVFQGPKGALGDDVVQPGTFDDNRVEKNFAGKLLRSHLGPAGDCAIASISGREISNEILALNVSVDKIGEPHLKDRVAKSGRTTGVTYGVVTRLEVNTKMEYGNGIVATIGGFEIGPDPKKHASNNEISRGGDSGSVWLAVNKDGPTDVMLGLHFGGDGDGDKTSEFALACYAQSVMNKLEIEPAGTVAQQQAVAQSPSEDVPRDGYDQNFLGFSIPTPTFRKNRSNDLASLDGKKEIPYCHFSVWLSKRRKYPLCVAWNIDGAAYKKVERVGFRTDRRGDLEQYQLTDDIYSNNVIDKGHLARRADLCWGTASEARQGNYDSSFYSNITPQHQAFNQSERDGLWGRLENTVFDSENPQKLRISLMGGPVFSTKDPKFTQNDEECFLPREFWKLVAYVDDEDNTQKVFGFLLTQAKLIEGLVLPQGLDFDEWLWARITLQDLQEKTGVLFPKSLKDREVAFSIPQAVGAALSVKPLFSPSDYFA